MSQEKRKCPLCERMHHCRTHPLAQDLVEYQSAPCGIFFMWDHDVISRFEDKAEREKWHPHKIIALLQERRLRNEGVITPLLQFPGANYTEIPDVEVISIPELLAQWPQGFQERMDRSLCNFVRSTRYGPGSSCSLRRHDYKYLLFGDTFRHSLQADFVLNAMQKDGWISCTLPDHGEFDVLVKAEGWKKYDAITKESQNSENPVFVAMWFGGKERRKEMTLLFKDTLEQAINAAGYFAKRSDSIEHNDPIIDRVIEDIRRAPFVVAEYTNNNQGVYYEAGFARGRGIEVIYCVHEGLKVHFDVTGINHVRWSNHDDLRTKLTNRILGTMGQGPHDVPR